MTPETEAKMLELLERIAFSADYTRTLTIGQVKILKTMALGPEPVMQFYYKGVTPVRFYVPKAAMDHIQGHQILADNFWDVRTLEILAPFVRGKHVLDIGANVGNHMVYFAKIAKARSVTAFEPMPELYEIVRRNIAVNDLEGVVEAHRCGLGSVNGTADVRSDPENRMQSTVFPRGDGEGGVTIRSLDSFAITRADFAKIDVEGQTMDMLKGAVETFARCRPSLYVELLGHERDECIAFLADRHYRVLGEVEHQNYLFVHPSRPDHAEALRGCIQPDPYMSV